MSFNGRERSQSRSLSRSQSRGGYIPTSNSARAVTPTDEGARVSFASDIDVSVQRDREGESLKLMRKMSARDPSESGAFKVVIRTRPPLPREIQGDVPFKNVVHVQKGQCQQLTIGENLAGVLNSDGTLRASSNGFAHTFTFDYVYDQDATQQSVYDNTARSVVESSLQGYNATIFAYGQTGTGKTHTMEGYHQHSDVEDRGIIPRAIEQIFGYISANASPRMRFLVRASYLQIYNEQISDLLKPERNNLAIREDKRRGVFVEGLSEWVVRSPAEIYGLMERGALVRATGSTKLNEMSSRSHAVFIIICEQSETLYIDQSGRELSLEEFMRLQTAQPPGTKVEPINSFKVGKLNLVDLAGSERVGLSGATGSRLQESKMINQSLSSLGNVIAALTDPKGRNHIPYRDSKLTRILEDSLGGNCRTTMMAMISPALQSITESLSTLKFANRAKNIKNEAKINEDLDQKSLLRKYERELKRLRAELETRARSVVDNRRLLELDEQRKRAEADKMAAIRALEARSREFQREKEEKRRLEERIETLTSQVIRGEQSKKGSADKGGGSDKGNSDQLRHEYEGRLQELEKERECIEEEKAQVERYKQLLLKQRDIMIALTQRLNERDEQIINLQDELDATEKRAKTMEEKLDEKTVALIRLQKVTIEQNVTSPVKNMELNQALGDWAPESENSRKKSSPDKMSTSTEMPRSLFGEDVTHSIELHSDEVPPQQLIEQLRRKEVDLEDRDKLLVQAAEHLSRGGADPPEFVRQNLSEYLRWALRESELKKDHQEQERVGGYELTTLKKELEKKDFELQQSIDRLRGLEQRQSVMVLSTERIEERCSALVRERKAVQTIMELKVQVLVNEVAKAAQSLVQGNNGAIQKIGKELSALQRLVGASIQALRNAQHEDDLREKGVS